MQFRNPETRRPTGLGWTTIALGAGLVLAPVAYAVDKSNDTTATAEQSGANRPNLQWPGRIALAKECPEWSTDTLSHAVERKVGGATILITSIDARLSAPSECDPEKDWGAGPQKSASIAAANVNLPDGPYYATHEGNDYVKDGVAARVVKYTDQGQRACQKGGANSSTTWYELEFAPGGPRGWVAEPNLDPRFLPSETQLTDAKIPRVGSPHKDTAQGGC
jgi:hypothetical protein